MNFNSDKSSYQFDEKFSFDLHVLNAPPAFILSQDQTLVWNFLLIIHALIREFTYIFLIDGCTSRTTLLWFVSCIVYFSMCSCSLDWERLYYSTKSQLLSTHFFIFFEVFLTSNFLCFVSSLRRLLWYYFLYSLSTLFLKNFKYFYIFNFRSIFLLYFN